MDLLTYISDKKRKAYLVKATGNNPRYLWQVATGRRNASWQLAKDIEDFTGGLVTKHELRPEIYGPLPSRESA